MAEPLRIGLLTHSVNPRGGVVHTVELARALHELGHAVTVFAPAQAGQRLFRPVPFELQLVPVGPPPADLADSVAERIAAFVSHLAPRLAAMRFDVLHTHDGIGGNALATLAESGLGGPFVRTVHHLDDFADPRLAAWQRRSVVAAAQLLVVSDGWRQRLEADFGRAAERVDNGVDLQRYGRVPDAHDAALAARLGLRADAPRWLLVGGIEPRKNTLRVLQAFGRLRAAHPGAQLVVAGGASLLDHRDYAARCHAEIAALRLAVGPGRDVVLTGTVPDADMPALFRQCTALAMPSLREGFGLVVLEALACGTPVLVSNRPPFTEYLDETVAAGHALYVDPEDPRAIAAALHDAAQPARRAALASAVPPVCHAHGWARSAERHVALYRAGGAGRGFARAA